MANPSLFKDPVELFHGRKPYSMPLYQYLARSDREFAVRCRRIWNLLYQQCDLTEDVKVDIHARFRSDSDPNHLGAMTELLVYSMFAGARFVVESAPELPSGKPDFKVQSSTSGSFYVEVTCALGDNVHSEDERNRGRVFELIDTIESFNFRVGLAIRGEVPARFNKKMIRDQVHTWLRTLDYQEMVRRKASEQITMEVEKKIISIGSGSIELTPIVIDPPRSSSEHGFVMFGPTGEMQLVITDKYIRNKVKAKARQLKGSDLPSLVVVNVLEPFMDDDDILRAFFGDLVPMGPATLQPMRVQRSMKGAWVHNGRPQNRSVDAVLLLKNVGHDCIPSEEPKLVMNPFAEKDRIPMDIPFCRYFVPTPEGLRLTEITIKGSSVERTRDAWQDHWPLP